METGPCVAGAGTVIGRDLPASVFGCSDAAAAGL